MNTTKVIIISIITALVVSLGVGGLVLHQASQGGLTFGTQVQNDVFWFTSGIQIGNTGYAINGSGAAVKNLSVNGGNPLINMTTGTSTIASPITLGTFPNTTSTATTTVTVATAGSQNGWVVGDGCVVTMTGLTSTSSVETSGYLSQVATTTATATIDLLNTNSGSGITIASGTFKKVRCFQ